MPFYEYQCEACGHQLEALQKMSDDPLVFCPECNESALKKLISKAAFRLKGTGWYETDFKDNSNKKEEKKSNDGASQTAKTSESAPAKTKSDKKSDSTSSTA